MTTLASTRISASIPGSLGVQADLFSLQLTADYLGANSTKLLCPVQAVSSKPAEVEDVFSVVSSWLADHGAAFPMMEMVTYGDYDEYRGVQASQNIKENDVIMSIPEQFMLTERLAMLSDIGKRVHAALPDIYTEDEDHLYLAVYLLDERSKGKDSFWHKYLVTLPTDFTNMAAHWGEKEIETLKESNLYHDIYHSDVTELKEAYHTLCGAVADFCVKHSYDDYIWARLNVRTRLFSAHVDGVLRTTMVPFADMFNHDSENVATWRFDDATRRFEIYAEKPITPGTPITISYGADSNRKLLTDYGFTTDQNPDGSAEVIIKLPEGENADIKALRVAKGGYPDASNLGISFQVPVDSELDDFYAPIRFARVAAATPEELEEIEQGGDSIPSLQCEKDAIKRVQAALVSALHSTPSSKEADEKLLADESLSFNVRNIIRVRHSERQSSLDLLEQLDLLLTLSEVSQAEFNKLRAHPKYAKFADYLESIAELHRRRLAVSMMTDSAQ
ncbi:hypothetical protein HDU78_008940 [Chytriomyces hyalinus]|nr:hypothetical protein HDU78_008940 [Chytriomyces hyalinus]